MKILRLLSLLFVWALPLTATAQNFQQSFDSYPALFTGTNPWAVANRSDSPTGGLNWFEGQAAQFAAQTGAANSYIAANFLSTGGQTGTETISNWLLTPTLNLTTAGTMTFYTRSAGGAPDRLEVRLSLSGTSTNVGTTSADTGDFTLLLLTVNPTTTAGVYPTAWTQFTVTVPGVATGATGRLAFRYNVANSGNNGANGDYIGVDTLTSSLTVVPEPSTYALAVAGLGVVCFVVRRRRQTVQA